MSKTWTWIGPYIFVILAMLLAGPLLSSLAMFQSVTIPYLQINGPFAIRLSADLLAIAAFWTLGFNARSEIPDNGRGMSFLRNIALPLVTFTGIIFTYKAFRLLGTPLIERIGSSLFASGYAIGLVGSGLWITTVWLMSHHALREAFSPPGPTPRRGERTRTTNVAAEHEDDRETPQESTPATATSTIAISAPNMLGRYKVLKEIGRGAMGQVYLGKDPTIQRFVAIKTLRLDQIKQDDKLQEATARFFREAKSTGRLSHPNIVTIYDAGEEGALGYIAMELIEGTPLEQWTRPPNLMPLHDVLQTVATVADAMGYAHQQGVVHRDIKPANIMITKDRMVKIMDFGIAKMASNSTTKNDLVLGTPLYMSPEQIAGKNVDGRSDIFSLGVVLFELLTGQPPFNADNLSALLFSITHHPHPALHTLRPDLPPMVQEIVDRALQKDLPHRYRRAEEFASDIRTCLHRLAA
ncbi:MAG: serine/threonine protein kinase [Nitrospira sp.]|nr:serine/threonine protein kinase [Nitrospira sp.]